MPIHLPEPRYKNPPGRSNSVLPLVVPSCTPRSRISIASVTMNALSRSRTIRKPLIAPTTAPVEQHDRNREPPREPDARAADIDVLDDQPRPQHRREPDHRFQRQVEFSGEQDQASRRSRRPESSEDCCRMLRKLSVVRKASEANAPMTITSTITGTSVSSRNPSSETAAPQHGRLVLHRVNPLARHVRSPRSPRPVFRCSSRREIPPSAGP